MARQYAGILGLSAFAAMVLRGVIHGSSPEPTFLGAAIALFVFAAVGAAVGRLAAATVEQSVQVKFIEKLQQETATQDQATPR